MSRTHSKNCTQKKYDRQCICNATLVQKRESKRSHNSYGPLDAESLFRQTENFGATMKSHKKPF